MRPLTREEKAATLRRLRAASGMGQRKLARLVGVEPRVIADMEHERRPLGIKRARKIAKALGVNVKDLLFEDWVPFGESNFVAE